MPNTINYAEVYSNQLREIYGQRLTCDKLFVQLTAQAYFIGDIAPSLPALSNGEVEVYGVKRRIFQGEKARNPDGTVNYTRLDLV